MPVPGRPPPASKYTERFHTMRLGFDLDGTLADLQGALGRTAAALFPGIDPSTLPRSLSPSAAEAAPAAADAPEAELADGSPEPPATWSASALTSRQQRELWAAVCARANFWESLDELEPGALARLSRLARERRWEIIFLTSRPETAGDTAQMQSHRWLAAHGFESPSVFVVHGSRGKIASALALEVLVDDRPENCLDVAIDSSARPILVWRGDEGKVPGSARQLGIGAVASINECLDILELIDRPDAGGAGMIDRLKRLLGLKPRAQRPRGAAADAATPAASTRPAG